MDVTLPTSHSATRALPYSMMALLLDRYHLSHAGPRKARAERLWNHLRILPASSSEATDPLSDEEAGSRHATETDSSVDSPSDEEADSTPLSNEEADSDTPDSVRTTTGSDSEDSHICSDSRPSTSSTRPPARDRPSRHRRHRYSVSPSLTSMTGSPGRDSTTPHRRHRRHAHHTTRSHRPRSPHSHRRRRHSSSFSRSPRPYKSRRTSRRQPKGAHSGRTQPPHSVSASLVRKIRRGEFVDLPYVLADAQLVAGFAAGSGRQKPWMPIGSLSAWLQAWSLVAGILVSYNPSLGAELFQYQSFIVRSSSRFRLLAWLQYDCQFRRRIAVDTSRSWATVDQELVATWLSADATKSNPTCYTCGEQSHMAAECPFRNSADSQSRCTACSQRGHPASRCPSLPNTAARDRPPSSRGQPRSDCPGSDNPPVCKNWNANRCRQGDRCPRRHVCESCFGPHFTRSCHVRVYRP